MNPFESAHHAPLVQSGVPQFALPWHAPGQLNQHEALFYSLQCRLIRAAAYNCVSVHPSRCLSPHDLLIAVPRQCTTDHLRTSVSDPASLAL